MIDILQGRQDQEFEPSAGGACQKHTGRAISQQARGGCTPNTTLLARDAFEVTYPDVETADFSGPEYQEVTACKATLDSAAAKFRHASVTLSDLQKLLTDKSE